jgi:hypothetical protein
MKPELKDALQNAVGMHVCSVYNGRYQCGNSKRPNSIVTAEEVVQVPYNQATWKDNPQFCLLSKHFNILLPTELLSFFFPSWDNLVQFIYFIQFVWL